MQQIQNKQENLPKHKIIFNHRKSGPIRRALTASNNNSYILQIIVEPYKNKQNH